MVVIKKPGMQTESKESSFKAGVAENLNDVSGNGTEDTVSDGPVIEKEKAIDDQTNDKQPPGDSVGSKIKGWEETMSAKTSPRTVRTLNPNSTSWRVHEVIANYAEQPNLEYCQR